MMKFTVWVSNKYVEEFQIELRENIDINFMILGWEDEDGTGV